MRTKSPGVTRGFFCVSDVRYGDLVFYPIFMDRSFRGALLSGYDS